MSDQKYNADLVGEIKGIIEYWNSDPLNVDDQAVHVKIDYLAQRSIDDNIDYQGDMNMLTVSLSYLLGFLYLSLTIGFSPNWTHNKFGFGIVGMVIVIGSLLTGIGLTFYFNTPIMVISEEVMPFFILSIATDGMFLIAKAEQEVPKTITNVEERIAYAMKDVGPSLFIVVMSAESMVLFLGTVTRVPALSNFCLIAGIGVIISFLLQMTIFVGALAIDNHRVNSGRADVICCWKVKNPKPAREEILNPRF